ncbi:MAG: hypothetical protein ACI4MJ_00130 [Aristaeellaceae bacterium]
MTPQKKATITFVCGIVCLVSAAIILVLRLVMGNTVVQDKEMFLSLFEIVFGIYFTRLGWKGKKAK